MEPEYNNTSVPEVNGTPENSINVTLDKRDLYEVIDAGVALIKGIHASTEDDKFSIIDIPNFFPFLMKLPVAIKDIDKAILYLKAANEEEQKEIENYFRQKLELSNAVQLEEFIEKTFIVVLGIYKLIVLYRDMITVNTEVSNNEGSVEPKG